jgi:hypothetical protein
MNVCGDNYVRAAHMARIRGTFGDHVVTLQTKDEGNLIVIASRRALLGGNTCDRESDARALQQRFGLNFPRYLRKMKRVARFA